MTSQYRHRRTSTPSTAFPNPLEPGEIAVNTANRQLAVGDAQAGVVGQPLPLLALRYFDTRAVYAQNDMVQQAGVVYRAKGVAGPGAFTPAQWDMLVGSVDPQYVAKAGDTMTGPLALPAAAPTLGVQATNKTYVDTAVANKSSVISSETPPVGAIDNTLWFETDTGLLFVKYNDGTSSQWVIACPQPDTSMFVQRTGDTMTGALAVTTGAGVTPLAVVGAAAKLTVDYAGLGKNYHDAAEHHFRDAAGTSSRIIFSSTGALVSGDVAAVTARVATPVQTEKSTLVPTTEWVKLYAAPLDAMAFNGMQVNGAFLVSQEKGAAGTTAAGYFCDGWVLGKGGTAAVTATPIMNNDGYGPYSSLVGLNVQTAQPSMGASDFVQIMQSIEGVRVGRLLWGLQQAAPITIGFWCQHHRTGVWGGAVRNSDYTRSCAFTYTQNVADTPEYKTVTIPGDQAGAGTWLRDTSAGLRVDFCIASGSSYVAPTSGAWYSGNYITGPGQVNGVGATNDAFRLSGVIVLPGTEAPTSARSQHILRPADTELVLCQRYWSKGTARLQTYCTAANNFMASMSFPATMRITPTIVLSNFGLANSANPAITQPTNTDVLTIYGTATATGMANWQCDWTADARLT